MASPISIRILKRFSLKYIPKETKRSKVDRLAKIIREATGISKSQAVDIAEAVVRKRDLEALTLQKGLPIEDGIIVGPKGLLPVEKILTLV
jgi:hypothetical protein